MNDGYSPPRIAPRIADQSVLLALIAAIAVVFFGVVLHQLFVVVFVLTLLLQVYVVWRFLRALEAVADGTQRLAAAREREADAHTPGDSEDGTRSPAGDSDGDDAPDPA